MTTAYNINSSFNNFYQKCREQEVPGIKVIAFPTGMGKTHGAAISAIQVAKDGNLPIFIAPRIAILKDFEETVVNKNNDAKVVRLVSNTELQKPEYYLNNHLDFKEIASKIEQQFLDFIINNNFKLPLNMLGLENYFSNIKPITCEKDKDQIRINNLSKIFKSVQYLKRLYSQINLMRGSKITREFKTDLEQNPYNPYNKIIELFQATNFFFVGKGNSEIYSESKEIFKIYGFDCVSEKIVKDFFGLSFVVSAIKKNQKNNNFIITLTSAKSLKPISRLVEVNDNKVTLVKEVNGKNLFLNTYLNLFCKKHELLPVYYIDESDTYYGEIVDDRTKIIELNNLLFKTKTFFDYSNISSLLSFIQKIEKNKSISQFVPGFKELFLKYNGCFTAEKIKKLIDIFEKNKIKLSPNANIVDKKIIEDINKGIQSDNKMLALLKNFENKENILFLYLCFLSSLGISDKIGQINNDKINKNSQNLFLGDLHQSLQNTKDFLASWNKKDGTFVLNGESLFYDLFKIRALLDDANFGETIIKNEDFIVLAEHNKFMFGNDQLSLIEEQIAYLNKLEAVDNYSDNALMELKEEHQQTHAINLGYMFSFLTKVLIRTMQSISYISLNESDLLDKELSCSAYLKKMKQDFSKIEKIDDSGCTIKSEDMLFGEDYIFNQNKNIINLFTSNYSKSLKIGKPIETSYIQMSNIHIQSSPEEELLRHFMLPENEGKLLFGSNSVVFLMSATSLIMSYSGNFDYNYLFKKFKEHGILYDSTYTNMQDIDLVNSFKLPYLNKKVTDIQILDYGIYNNNINNNSSNKQFQLYKEFDFLIKKSDDEAIKRLNDKFYIYKNYEFQSFVFSIESLILNSQINSLCFISQTTEHIISFINFYLANSLNKSGMLIKKFHKKNQEFNDIFILNKDAFNAEHEALKLDKDLIIIFYDSKFENKQINILNLSQNSGHLAGEVKAAVDEDGADISSDHEIDNLDYLYDKFKKEIFNEDKYKILLCSSFGAISRGFNFVTQKNGEEKDFDSINIGMDPYFDRLERGSDKALVYQRINAMKDFNFKNNRACNLNEFTDHFYANRSSMVEREHLAHIAGVVIQSLGRIERRRHKGNNRVQHLFINMETYQKLEKFYHFYEYNKYMANDKNNKSNFSSNLSVNNQFLFDLTQNKVLFNNLDTVYENYLMEQVEKNNILEELVTFLLEKVRKNEKTKQEFKEIWSHLKSPTIFNNFKSYLETLNNTIEPKLILLIKKYAIKKEFPLLITLIEGGNQGGHINDNKIIKPQPKYKLEDIFFVKFPKEAAIGISTHTDAENKSHEVIVDYNNANKSGYNLFKMIFSFEKEDLAGEVLEHMILFNSSNSVEKSLKECYVIGDTLHVPQRKTAVEFIKSAISEDIFRSIAEKHGLKLIDNICDNSYEIYDFFIQHKTKEDYTAIDIKFWSNSTQALNSKHIEYKVNKKSHQIKSECIKNNLIINLFGKTASFTLKNSIYYSSILIKSPKNNSVNYGKYILNQEIIKFLQEETKK